MSESDTKDGDQWICPECEESWPSADKKVPGGCVSCVDLLRYIEYEAPGMGVVENDPTALQCFNGECQADISVDPDTLVTETPDAVTVKSETFDPETGQKTGGVRVEIYCSPECRNEQYRTEPGEEVNL